MAVVEKAEAITLPLIERAATLMHWYLAEALRLNNPAKPDHNLVQAQSLFDWLYAKGWHSFEARTLQREGPRFARKSAALRDKLLSILVEHYYLLSNDGKHYRINPLATAATTATAT